jgi:hypothetical protein
VTAVVPASGSEATATVIVVEGAGFVSAAQVLLGTTLLAGSSVQSAAVIEATVPASMTPGVYSVTVIDPTGAKVVLDNGFTVEAAAAAGGSGGGCNTGLAGEVAWLPLWLGLRRFSCRRRRACRQA